MTCYNSGQIISSLHAKVQHLIEIYNSDVLRLGSRGNGKAVIDALNYAIKWTRSVKRSLEKGIHFSFEPKQTVIANYRPFVKMWMYRDNGLNEMPNLTPKFFGHGEIENPALVIMGDSSGKPFFVNAIDRILDLNYVSPASGGSQTFPLYHIGADGLRYDNITDWGLKQFRQHYVQPPSRNPGTQASRLHADGTSALPMTKEAIFHYCYAVLHDPVYREKYALNLKREFPRIPFYADFWQWAVWGEALMALHIGYESVEPCALQRTDTPDAKAHAAGLAPKAMLKADKDAGRIVLDSETTLSGVPPEAWDYKLGNRCALDWVLDQYKEKKPKDPTIRAQFDTYRFADYKEKVIDLLARVTTVSVRTVAIVGAMKQAAR